MIRIFTASLAILGVSACVSVLPEAKVPEGLYRFGPMEAVYDLDASIIIREPEASRLVAGRAIAAEDSSGALRLVRGVEWADTSTRLMQTALLDLFGGAGAGVAIAPDTGAPADYELSWWVSDFTLSDTTGRCRIRATLLDGRTRKVLDQTLISTSATAEGKTNAQRARALTEAGKACVSDVAAFIAYKTVVHAEEAEDTAGSVDK